MPAPIGAILRNTHAREMELAQGKGRDVPAVDKQVMKFVEDLLEKEPEIRPEELFNKTKEFKSSIGRLSKRQFNARYPLQVKRKRALATQGKKGEKGQKGAPPRKRTGSKSPKRKPSRPEKKDSPREVVRRILLEFATDITSAEERRDLVKVLARADRYVDRIVSGIEKA